ncbi:MAG: family 78 glycoside hydrolase catalytic domain [Clostridia bacterium]|nr:family 78 glycoside hydrolase catalytic domain [Clostridia bacterium]
MSEYRIVNGQCGYRINPLGVDDIQPRLTWVYQGENPDCQPAEIRVVTASDDRFDDILWDSGWKRSDITAMRCLGHERVSGQRIFWKAYTRLEERPETEAESEVYWFETGLLEEREWHGEWIRASADFEAPVMVRSFEIEALPKKARAYVCGLGVFELYVNGQRAGDEIMQPVLTAYSRQPLTNMLYPYDYGGVHRMPYLTFDIAPYLNKGLNTIGVHLGNGWYHQAERLVEGDLWYGASPVLLAEIRLDERVIATGTDWQWREDYIVRNNLFFGEEADYTRGSFDLRPVMTAEAPDGMLRAQACASDAAMEAYPLINVLKAADGKVILDFGQNLAGVEEITVTARPGDRIELTFSEEIKKDGDVWQMDYESAGGTGQIQEDVFTFSGIKDEKASPKFCWHGFRYAEAKLIRECGTVPMEWKNGKLTAAGFTMNAKARFTTVNHAVAGCFSCDNDVLNWYHETSVVSLRANEHCGVPLDCPHRERLGYTGDGQLVTPVTLLNLGAAAFVDKWLNDILDAQHRKTGHVPHTVPFYNGGGGPGGWGGAIVFVPWALYRHTGDENVLRRAWPQMLKWMKYLDSRSEDGVVVREQDGGWCLGDWCVPGTEMKIEPALVNTAMTMKMLEEMIEMAGILGEDQDSLRTQWNARRDGFRKAFLNANEMFFGAGCQGATAMAMWCGAVNEEEKERAFARVLKEVENAGFRFDTGIFATPILLEVLSENGRPDAAFRLMSEEEYPSFGYMRACGATTLYENWEYERGSHNHQMFAAADEWLYSWAAGLSQAKDSAGWRKAVLRPGAVQGLNKAEAKLETVMGTYFLSWERAEDGLHVTVHIPALAQAEMLLPDGRTLTVPPGKHEYVF